MAIASAEVLGKELMRANNDFKQALLAQEQKLRPIIERLQRHSRKIAAIYIPGGGLKYHTRNLFLKLMPYSWIVSWYIKNFRAEIDLTQGLAS